MKSRSADEQMVAILLEAGNASVPWVRLAVHTDSTNPHGAAFRPDELASPLGV